MTTLRIIDEVAARTLIDTATALDLARTTLRRQSSDASRLSTPAAMFLDATPLGGPRFKFKAASVGHLNVSGVRLLARRSGNTGPDASNFTAVYDHSTGRLAGLVSEIWLSRIRTAAFAVAAVEPLVSPGPLTVGLFGAGDVAAELVPLLDRAFEIEEIRVKSRRQGRTVAFARRVRDVVSCPVRVEPVGAAVVAGAGLVVTATEANEPLVRPGQLAQGAVLCSMGSYNEVDVGVLAEIDRLVVDDLDYATIMGDAAAWLASGQLTREALEARIDARAADVAGGHVPGRLAPDDRILALIQGIATGDVAFAWHALRRAEAQGVGHTVELPESR